MVSIALTTYNGEKYLREQLDSILLQTIQDFEVVVCDDRSCDSTWCILEEYAQKDSRFKIHRNEKNLGFLKNFEQAISLCTGDYIALCDQDDIWLNNHVQILLEHISDYTLCGANALLVDGDNKDLNITLLDTLGVDYLPQNQEDFEFFLFHSNVFQGAALLFKKELISRALPFPENVEFHDHWLALVACSMDGVNYVNVPVLRYRQHGSNVTKNKRFSLCNKIFEGVFDSDKRFDIKASRIQKLYVLECYEKFCNTETVEEAKKYYKNLIYGKRIRALSYFIKNREKLVLSHKKNIFISRILVHLYS